MVVDSRRAKIIATVGPACASLEGLADLLAAGADVLRVNTSHLTPAQAEQLYRRIETVRAATARPFATLVDLQGPKLRLGETPRQDVQAGDRLRFSEDGRDGSLPVSIPGLAEHAQPGQQLVLGDGAPTLQILAVRRGALVEAEVRRAGQLRARMGAALLGADLQLPALTDQDRQHLQVAAPYADWVALSFVSCAEDLYDLRLALRELQCPARLMAKIERAAALQELDEVIDEADGVMVARGDLGVELGLASVPFAQARVVEACVRAAKPAVIATQVLDSMTTSDLPTRAEAADVAQALIEGAAALMLSAETATGDHPALTVSTMNELIVRAERQLQLQPVAVPGGSSPAASLVRAADQLAHDQGVKVLLVPTNSGQTARLAGALTRQHVLALCPDPRVQRQLALEHGVIPLAWDGQHRDYLPVTVREQAIRAGLLDPQRRVVVAWSHEQPGQGPVQLVAALGPLA